MSALITGVVISSLALANTVRSGNIAKKGQDHAKDRAATRAGEISDKANRDTAAAAKKTKEDKAKRMAGYSRNTNVFGSAMSLSDQAASIKKNLTGQ